VGRLRHNPGRAPRTIGLKPICATSHAAIQAAGPKNQITSGRSANLRRFATGSNRCPGAGRNIAVIARRLSVWDSLWATQRDINDIDEGDLAVFLARVIAGGLKYVEI